MENNSVRNENSKKLRVALPKILNSPSSDNLNKQNIPCSAGRSHKGLDLKKLYFQYKSNARLLQSSPYNNPKSKKRLIEFLSSKRYQLSQQNSLQRTTHIQQSYRQDQVERKKKKQIRIVIAHGKANYRLTIFAENNAQIFQKLKSQFNQIESKTKKLNILQSEKRFIIGFETQKGNAQIDYVLSNPNFILPVSQIQLKPVYGTNRGKKVNIGDFKIIKCLGSGGFSTVFLSKGNFNNQYYAIKLIDKKFILDTQRQGIVQNQRYILGILKSPFVTELQFAFETKNHFALVIQYCPGGQLFYQLKKVRKMTEQQAKFYFLQILIGLDYIHEKNIIYRDLKPENLLIAADGHIKIADYGLSKPVQNSKCLSYSFCGSPQYMAPEMLLKSGHNKSLDFYCLGALLYELVVGIPPYYSTNHQEIYEAILTQQLSFPPHAQLSKELIDLLQGLLCKNANQRLGTLFGIKQILFHPWIGKIRKQTIQEKQLIPPFLPNPMQFNFDLNQIKEETPQLNGSLQQDFIMKDNFQTHFNDQFYYQHQSYKNKPKIKSVKSKKYRSLDRNIKQQKRTSKILKRNFSLTGFNLKKPISIRSK